MDGLSARDILKEAERTLASVPEWIWDGKRLPVPIDAIADSHFDLLVREVPDVAAEAGPAGLAASERISGALLPARGEILVDATEAERWPRRRRYTIAHELGHHVLHRSLDAEVVCREAHPAEQIDQAIFTAAHHLDAWRPLAAGRDIEWEANVFGGALLIPPRLLRPLIDQQGNYEEEQLAAIFDVSPSALNRRCLQHYAFATEARGERLSED